MKNQRYLFNKREQSYVVPLAYAILFNARDDSETVEKPEEQKA